VVNGDPRGAAATANLIEVRDLGMEFPAEAGSVRALDGVSFSIAPGEFFSIVGPSGCGKSTLLLILAGIVPPSEGTIRCDGRELTGTYADCSLVFQQDNLLEWRSVLDNVLLPVEIKHLDSGAGRARALELLGLVGLRGFERHFPYQLSGGMRQRAAICRALVYDARVLLMDEPFGALDALTREEHQVLLQEIWLRERKTVVFVTHDIREAVLLSDRVAVMSARPGRIRELLPIDLPRPRPRELTESVEFNQVVGHLRRTLESGYAAVGAER
jgi:NitT/TauT family transport system ATP-binding protein